ncbi:hypothetical protein SAMN02799630_00076 [Paenibacillus sp. UNCCL117]|nr:hypothetical protein SAMN04488602_102456 [Paenibacillus sp. cl123]SFW11158.1 hypothetical protein SAMN02799630_00076 [Paenibacillus sp. UNCCL117]
MFGLLIAGSILAPLLMFAVRFFTPKLALFFDFIAVAALYGFGWIATGAIYKILRDDTVMMTEVHRVFYSSWFLMSGAYLGVYALYVIWWALFSSWRKHP